MQAPFATKDWSILPVSVIAVGFLAYVGVWGALKLGLVRQEKANGDNLRGEKAGDVTSAQWREWMQIISDNSARTILLPILKEIHDKVDDLCKDSSDMKANQDRLIAICRDIRTMQDEIKLQIATKRKL